MINEGHENHTYRIFICICDVVFMNINIYVYAYEYIHKGIKPHS
jgi:hypothetical protein